MPRRAALVPTTCRATRSRVLAAVRDARGGPRFYRPYEHPATYRWRWTLAKLIELGAPRSDVTAYIEGQIETFEIGEVSAKRRCLRAGV